MNMFSMRKNCDGQMLFENNCHRLYTGTAKRTHSQGDST